MTDLGAWLAARASMRREPGVQDCCTFPGDWTIAAGWPDPMAEWRGAYHTAGDAAAFIAEAASLLALFERGFAAAGIPPREGEPLPGDVALIRIGELEAGAIYAGKRWAFVGERGVGMASVEPSSIAAVWAVGGAV